MKQETNLQNLNAQVWFGEFRAELLTFISRYK